MVGYIQMALLSLIQITGAMIHDRHIRIPFDVIYFRMFCHQIIHYTKNKILHLRIGQVEHHLRSASACNQFIPGSPDHPVRMFFIQFTGGIHHFRFNPDAELNALFLSLINQSPDTRRQFFLINDPISQRRPVCSAWILVTEPAIVHHKQFTAQRGDI